MAVSKRLRYEILRRDNHQCRYCGVTWRRLTEMQEIARQVAGSLADEDDT